AFCEPISRAVGRDRCAFCSRKRTVRTFLAGLCLALLVQAAAYAGADSVEAFYRGKVLTLFVGYGPGGGFDLIARLLARHLGNHIPGNPTIVVQNMPGAGSLVAANYLYNVAPRDGTQFG